MKGIVMDVKRKYLIVMSNDGGFYRARREGAFDVGTEISFIPLTERNNLFSFSNWKVKLASLTTACAVFGGILFAAISGSAPVYAYVSIDINPSIEFSVGSNWDIIKTTFTNKDGKELLSTLPNMQGKPIDYVLDRVIQAAKEEGKLQNKGNVWITSVLANGNLPEATAVNKLKQLQSDLEVKENVQIQVGTTSEKVRNDAEHIGVSPEKYVYFQNAAKGGTSISLQNLKNDSVTKLEADSHEKNKTSDTMNSSLQKVSKSPDEGNKSGEKSMGALSQGKKQAVDSVNKTTEKNTGNSSNAQSLKQKQKQNVDEGQQNVNDRQQNANDGQQNANDGQQYTNDGQQYTNDGQQNSKDENRHAR